MKSPPDRLPDEGILLGYSLERERRTAPIGFSYGRPGPGPAASDTTPTLDPILHTGGGHLMTIAPTGAGKGISCIIPSLLRYPGPVIVIDPKGENHAVTAERRRALGQEVVVLDPVGITGVTEPGALNPLDLIDTTDQQSIDDTAALASLLSGGIEREDPRNLFWYQRGEQLLTGIIQLVAVTRTGRDRTLGEVRRILNLPSSDFLEFAATQMANCPDPDVRQVAGTVVNPAQEMIGSILGMAQNSVGFLRGELVHGSTSTSSFALSDVTAGKPLSIYIVIPPDKLESHRNLLRVWIGTLMSALMRRRTPVDRSTLLILDEAAQLGPLDQLRQAVTLMRGYGLQTWSFWQDPSQLLNLYPRDWETMYNNCRVHQAFGFTTLKAAAATCDLLGFHDPLEALRLDADEMLLSVSGDEAVIAQKPNYLTDPAFRGLYAANPFYTKTKEAPPAPSRPTRVYVRPAHDGEGAAGDGGAATAARLGDGAATAAADRDSDEDAPADPDREGDAARSGPMGAVDASSGPHADGGHAASPPATVRPLRRLLDPLPGITVEQAREVPYWIARASDRLGGSWNPITTHVRGFPLPFWERHFLLELVDSSQPDPGRLVVVHAEEVHPFEGGADAIRTLARVLPTRLTEDTIADWVRFHCHFARFRDARMRVVENVDQLSFWAAAEETDLEVCAEQLHAVRLAERTEEGVWVVEAIALMDGVLRSVRIQVGPDGELLDVVHGPSLARVGAARDYPAVDLDGDPRNPVEADRLRAVHGDWEFLDELERRTAMGRLGPDRDNPVPAHTRLLRRRLLCCPGYAMLRLAGQPILQGSVAFYGPDAAFRPSALHPGFLRAFGLGLMGSSDEVLRLDHDAAVLEYVKLHHWFLTRSETEYTLFLDRFDQVPLADGIEPGALGEQLAERWVPLAAAPAQPEDAPTVAARARGTVLYGGGRVAIIECLVHRDGTVDLVDSEDLDGILPIDVPRLLRLLMMPPLGPTGAEGVPYAPPVAPEPVGGEGRPA